jgi:hypothetical protein
VPIVRGGDHGRQLTVDGPRASIGAKSLCHECVETEKYSLLDAGRRHSRLLAGG